MQYTLLAECHILYHTTYSTLKTVYTNRNREVKQVTTEKAECSLDYNDLMQNIL